MSTEPVLRIDPIYQNETIYIQNIPDKLSRNVIIKLLYYLFTEYGKINQIVVSKTNKLRGQAWIVFEDSASSLSALTNKQGYLFNDKPLVKENFCFSNIYSLIIYFFL